jgi:two-component system, chemotaxis family, chemotaxis protein CheY
MSNLHVLWSSVDKFIKNRVVLVADSHPHLRSITRTILLQLGVKVTREVNDGFEAIDAICTFDPCAMILDWGIRGMDAREVVRVVRTSGVVPDPKIPIIAVSGPIKKSKVIEARDLGIDYLVLRPVSPLLLQQRLFPALMKLNQPLSSRCG